MELNKKNTTFKITLNYITNISKLRTKQCETRTFSFLFQTCCMSWTQCMSSPYTKRDTVGSLKCYCAYINCKTKDNYTMHSK